MTHTTARERCPPALQTDAWNHCDSLARVRAIRYEGCGRKFKTPGALHTHTGWHKRHDNMDKGIYERQGHDQKVRFYRHARCECMSSHQARHPMSGGGLVLFRRRITSRTDTALSGVLTSIDARWKDVASSFKLAGRFSHTWAGTNASRRQREACQILIRLLRSLQACTLLLHPCLGQGHRRSKCQGRGSARTTYQVSHQGRPQRQKRKVKVASRSNYLYNKQPSRLRCRR
eukprot:COSAG02_NODE_7_length_64539_cov_120.393482_6_plen_231_part_00